MPIEKVSTGPGQDSISSIVQVLLRKNAVLTAAWTDVSQFAQPGDKSISFPRVENQFQVQKLVGAQKGDDQELVIDLDKLDLNVEAHIQWVIKKFDQARSKVNILQTAVQNATITSAEQLDTDLYNEFLAGLTTTAITGGITQNTIVDAITGLNNMYAPKTDRLWVFGTGGYGTLLKIAGFVDASASNMNIALTGQIGTLYGYPVLQSDVVATTEAFITHKQALCYGFGASPSIEDEKAIEYGTGSRRWVMDQLYGQKTLNQGKMAVRITA